MTYFEYAGKHYFQFGLIQLRKEGWRCDPGHWLNEPIEIKPEILQWVKDHGGEWYENGLEFIFPNSDSATLFKLTWCLGKNNG